MVLYGGQSAEHDISRVTARHVLAAIDPDRYDVTAVAITRDGRWLRPDEAAVAMASGREDGREELPDALPVDGAEISTGAALAAAAGETVVVLPLLHGPMGEDGTVQGLLELAGVPYVGCGVLSSAVAMDKCMAKQVLAANGIPQGRWRGVHRSEVPATDLVESELVAGLVADLGLPLFVKPANMGSSIGVSRATTHDEIASAITLALSYDEHLVVEEAITGREIECAVLGHFEDPRASLPGEVKPGAVFYDYEDKYATGTAELEIPADLPAEVVSELQDLANRTFRALRCEGMARVDVFYEEGGRGFLVNEVNTIPGFTPISMYPKMWEASGLTYRDLVDELIRLAVEHHARHPRRTDHL